MKMTFRLWISAKNDQKMGISRKKLKYIGDFSWEEGRVNELVLRQYLQEG